MHLLSLPLKTDTTKSAKDLWIYICKKMNNSRNLLRARDSVVVEKIFISDDQLSYFYKAKYALESKQE